MNTKDILRIHQPTSLNQRTSETPQTLSVPNSAGTEGSQPSLSVALTNQLQPGGGGNMYVSKVIFVKEVEKQPGRNIIRYIR